MDKRHLFLEHVGQTSPAPLCLNIVKAEGSLMWDQDGKEYIDLIGGISVCHVGHRHPAVVKAIREQADKYLHIMVYGELIANPQVEYATLLAEHLPASLNNIFFTASGSEATEGAMKLANRFTGRTEVISFMDSYHGSTQGALSIMGSEYWQQAFRPLLPGIKQFRYDDDAIIQEITTHTACVFAETIQAEAGVRSPRKEWMQALRKRCTETGTLLILDEIQCGFGRNGTMWAFEQFGIVPDVLLLGKALGGGLPLGAFIADKAIMRSLTHDPVLGHINTFGGHPLSCAAGLAAFRALLEEDMIAGVASRRDLFLELLVHPRIKSVHHAGLMLAVEFSGYDENKRVIDACIGRGVFTDWFLFAAGSLRIVPPLNISFDQIRAAASVIIKVLDDVK
jgi:acetylornithine/succinyldiaminopimelate/putrescine aminotransferase